MNKPVIKEVQIKLHNIFHLSDCQKFKTGNKLLMVLWECKLAVFLEEKTGNLFLKALQLFKYIPLIWIKFIEIHWPKLYLGSYCSLLQHWF